MLVKVKIFPQAKKEGVVWKAKNSLEIKVKEKPKQGRANQRMMEILAEHFHVNSRDIRITKGVHKPNKILEIKS